MGTLKKITFKKAIAAILVLTMMAGMFHGSSPASAATGYRGSDYTTSSLMAKRLDALFSAFPPNQTYFKSTPGGRNHGGDKWTPCHLRSDSRGNPVGTMLTCGWQDDNNQCIGYAYFAQYMLFGKSESTAANVNHGYDGASKIAYTRVYNPTHAQIRQMPFGTHLRYYGSYVHSMIVIKTTDAGITYLDCNCSWSCAIHLHVASWSQFFAKVNSTNKVSPGYASYPTAATYPNLFPTPTPKPKPYGSTPFVDIGSHWAKDYIAKAHSKSMIKGISADQFDPDGGITRAMFVQILYNMAKKPKTKGYAFSDVPSGSWYYKAVSWAANNKIVSGTGKNKFSPDALITREQASVILYNYLYRSNPKNPKAYPLDSLKKFDDAFELSSWAVRAMAWAVDTKLIKGRTSKTVAPTEVISRGEAVVLLLRVK